MDKLPCSLYCREDTFWTLSLYIDPALGRYIFCVVLGCDSCRNSCTEHDRTQSSCPLPSCTSPIVAARLHCLYHSVDIGSYQVSSTSLIVTFYTPPIAAVRFHYLDHSFETGSYQLSSTSLIVSFYYTPPIAAVRFHYLHHKVDIGSYQLSSTSLSSLIVIFCTPPIAAVRFHCLYHDVETGLYHLSSTSLKIIFLRHYFVWHMQSVSYSMNDSFCFNLYI
jgi:hypothetical protein